MARDKSRAFKGYMGSEHYRDRVGRSPNSPHKPRVIHSYRYGKIVVGDDGLKDETKPGVRQHRRRLRSLIENRFVGYRGCSAVSLDWQSDPLHISVSGQITDTKAYLDEVRKRDFYHVTERDAEMYGYNGINVTVMPAPAK